MPEKQLIPGRLSSRFQCSLLDRLSTCLARLRIRSSSSPTRISSLPFEILAHIFEIGSKDHRNGPQDIVLASSPHTFPPFVGLWSTIKCDPHHDPRFSLLVSHICRHWRIVAISTLTLWNVITIDSTTPWSNDIVLLQLERSDPAPLDIYITASDHRSLDSLYSQLVAHVHRWRFVDLSGRLSEVETFLNVVSRPGIPAAAQLTTLRLRQISYCGEYEPMSGALFGGSLPRLNTFFLRGLPVNWQQTWISAASNLRDLTLFSTGSHKEAPLSWVQLATILCGAPRLESLSLMFFLVDIESLPFGSLHPMVRNTTIPVPKLTQFTLMYTTQALTIFRRLYMPALKSLTLDLPIEDYTELALQLVGPATSLSSHSPGERRPSLLNRLEQLNLFHFDCTQDARALLYGELINVKSLSVPPSTWNQSFLGLLLPYTSAEQNVMIRVPRLEHLYVTRPLDDLYIVRKVVTTRRNAGVPIKELHLIRYPDGMMTSVVREEWNNDVDWLRNNVEIFGIENWN